MKPISPNRSVVVSTGETKRFSITESEKAYQLLSDPYSDKPRAVVRELFSNAWDAHRMNWNQHIPIQMTLPTTLSPEFIVRDFGPGMEHSFVMDMYSSYFKSTKDSSDEDIGGLGVGCKSPFSMADTFTVTSCFENIETQYVCFKDEVGRPTITVLSSREMSNGELSGVTISVAIPHDYITKIWDNVRLICGEFPTKPHVLNTPFDFPEYTNLVTTESSMIRTYPNVYYSSSARVTMGHIQYPLDCKLLSGSVSEKAQKVLELQNLIIKCDIGECELPISRESLSYDERTIQNLERKLEKVFDELIEVADTALKTYETPWEAFKGHQRTLRVTTLHGFNKTLNDTEKNLWFYSALDPKKDLFSGSHNISKFNPLHAMHEWTKDHDVRAVWVVSSTDEPSKVAARVRPAYRPGPIQLTIPEKYYTSWNALFVIADTSKQATQRLSKYLASSNKETVYSFVIDEITSEKDIRDFLQTNFCNPDVVLLSSLPVPPSTNKKASDQEIMSRITRASHGQFATRRAFPVSHGGIYVQSAPGDYIILGSRTRPIDSIKKLFNVGILGDVTIHGVDARTYKKLENNKQWTKLEDLIEQGLVQFTNQHALILPIWIHIINNNGFTMLAHLVADARYSALLGKLGNSSPVIEYLNIIRQFYLTSVPNGSKKLLSIECRQDTHPRELIRRKNERHLSYSYFSSDIVHVLQERYTQEHLTKVGISSNKLDDLVDSIFKVNPMLELIPNNKYDQASTSAIILEYIV